MQPNPTPPSSPARRRYTTAFKKRVIKKIHKHGATQTAARFALNERMIRRWLEHEHDLDSSPPNAQWVTTRYSQTNIETRTGIFSIFRFRHNSLHGLWIAVLMAFREVCWYPAQGSRWSGDNRSEKCCRILMLEWLDSWIFEAFRPLH